jgi:hypothetical protein
MWFPRLICRFFRWKENNRIVSTEIKMIKQQIHLYHSPVRHYDRNSCSLYRNALSCGCKIHRRNATRYRSNIPTLLRTCVRPNFIKSAAVKYYFSTEIYLNELDPRGRQDSVYARQKPPQPLGSSGLGAHRQTGTISSNRATQTSPDRHWLHNWSKVAIDVLLNRKCVCPAFVGRMTLKEIRGRGVRNRVAAQLHGRISMSAADTVDPAMQGVMTLFGRLAVDSIGSSGRLSRNKHRRLRDCIRIGSQDVSE